MKTLAPRLPGPTAIVHYPLVSGAAPRSQPVKELRWEFMTNAGQQALYAFGPTQPDGFALMLWIVALHKGRFALYVGDESEPLYFTTIRSAQDAAMQAAFPNPTGGGQ